MKLKTLILTMQSDKTINENAVKLRGFFAKEFDEYILLHHHRGNRFIYKYPLIQYKIIKDVPIIVSISEGVEVLKIIYDKYHSINLGGNIYEIMSKEINVREDDFGIKDIDLQYSFLTPWLALNERNYERYGKLIVWSEKKKFLEKILVGNILSMSKSLGYTVTEPVKAVFGTIKEKQTSLKGTRMLGFMGTFSVNFEIPDYWGLGKSVSRGFGTVKRGSGSR